jgi:hypothetical protein
VAPMDGWLGSSSTAAYRRGAGRSPLLCFDTLPGWKLIEFQELESPLPNKRRCVLRGSPAPPLFFLTGLGGEGEEDGACVSAMLWGWLGGSAIAADMMSSQSKGSTSLSLPT